MTRPQIEDREAVLADLFELLRYPSISASPAHSGDVRACAVHLAEYLQRLGLQAEVAATSGHPAVIARTPSKPGRRTLLVYGHYDVQPVEPLELWDRPPFEPCVVDGNLRGRGTSDDKGQLFCHIAAVGAYLRACGECPVNVVFLIEGEEEIGSPNLWPLVERRRDELACDAIVISDTALHGEGVPAICYGLRGMAYLEVVLDGPRGDLHSGAYGGAIDNPANVLARMLSSLFSPDGRIAIDGFYDSVRALDDDERRVLQALADDAALVRSTGVAALGGEPGYTSVECIGARPSLDINGLVAGHTGEGPKTVLPARATAKFSFRLVPDQDPDTVVRQTVAHLENHCPPTVRMTVNRLGEGPPLLVPLDTPELDIAREALKAGFDGQEPVFVREGGSIPVVATLAESLEAPCLLLGFGRHDDNLHAPNEKLNQGDFFRGIDTAIALFDLAATR